MCLFATVWVPTGRKKGVTLPETPAGLVSCIDEFVQSDFSKIHEGENGVFVGLHDGHCLCKYNDWNTLFRYVDDIRKSNGLTKAELLVYWTDNEYPQMDRIEFDRGLDDPPEKPAEGKIYEITTSIPRRLASHIGNQVHLHFKSGRDVWGTLQTYTIEGGNGTLQSNKTNESVYFNDKEIAQVENVK